MRAMKVLGGLVLVGSVSLAFAADKQVVAQNEMVVAKKVKVAHVPAAKNRVVAAKENFENDSRVNGYRLEQESCCGPQ
jgi:hypothetical protein